jgi:DNA-binding NtrC family response regulator
MTPTVSATAWELAKQAAIEPCRQSIKYESVERRILIVDDHPPMLEVLRIAFTGRGWQVQTAALVEDAIACFRSAPFDVILTDKNLPDRSGVDLIRYVRARDDAVGIVLITGYGTVDSARETLNLGVDEYLEKPFGNVFDVVANMERLRARAIERRRVRRLAPVAAEPFTAIVATADPTRRATMARLLEHRVDRLVFVEQPDAFRSTARIEKPHLLILDGNSYPMEITCLVAEVTARVRCAACVVLSESLTLADVKRLIQLEVRALIDYPIDSIWFESELLATVERLRRARHPASPGR